MYAVLVCAVLLFVLTCTTISASLCMYGLCVIVTCMFYYILVLYDTLDVVNCRRAATVTGQKMRDRMW